MSILKKLFKISNNVRVIILNTLFWGLVIFMIFALFVGRDQEEKGDVLYISFSDSVVESPQVDSISDIITSKELSGSSDTLLRDVLNAIKLAIDDRGINAIVLDLDYLVYIGRGSVEEIGSLLDEFKDVGGLVYAFSSFYAGAQYELATYGTNVVMDPFGELELTGISNYRVYYKDAFDKFGIHANVFRAGEYKSYVEPYIRSDMSDVVKKQNLLWMNELWSRSLDKIAENRKMEKSQIIEFTTNRPKMLKRYFNETPKMLKGEGFIDELQTRDYFFRQFDSLYDYMDYLSDKKSIIPKKKIGVITIEGTITESDSGAGSVSSMDILDNIDTAYFDDSIKGVIVRINSGGGGVFASEEIRRALEELKEEKPVIVSMGDVCASGGYWIATAGDKIFADSATITGSIGVFSLSFNGEKFLENYLNIHSDGVSTSPYNMGDLTRGNSKEYEEILQMSVDETYHKFLALVAVSRNKPMEKIEKIAGGRVWTGSRAKKLFLVDSIGGILDAKKYLNMKFGVNESELVFIDTEKPLWDTLLDSATSGMVKEPKILENLSLFDRINDPKKVYAIW